MVFSIPHKHFSLGHTPKYDKYSLNIISHLFICSCPLFQLALDQQSGKDNITCFGVSGQHLYKKVKKQLIHCHCPLTTLPEMSD